MIIAAATTSSTLSGIKLSGIVASGIESATILMYRSCVSISQGPPIFLSVFWSQNIGLSGGINGYSAPEALPNACENASSSSIKSFNQFIETLIDRVDLSESEADSSLEFLLNEANEALISAFLVLLRAKGETYEEGNDEACQESGRIIRCR
ncbi:Anthranilate phosphoribosyltransferase [Cardamine amara subsp. amara]|uniref:Anthranilate phosphoribosyltransferase n=1 Tax=Cardamine amara subsp. amara TaxID=228776 RepID=A0ABD1ANN1_CARAN